MNANRTIGIMTAGTLALFTALGTTAQAGNRHEARTHTETARVIKVKPIYETVRVELPGKRHCRKEKHHYSDFPDERFSSRDSYTAPIVGAIVGGVVGNRFGHGNGNKAMTVAGTLLGASIAADMADSGSRSVRHAHYTERHCSSKPRFTEREELVGYRVKYRYRGETYGTRMDKHPGDTIRLRVTHRPLDH